MSNIDLLKLQSLLDDHRHYLLQGYNVVSNPYLRTEDIQMSNTILDKDKLNEKFPGNSFYNYVNGNETGSISETYAGNTLYEMETSFGTKNTIAYNSVALNASLSADYQTGNSILDNNIFLKQYQAHVLGRIYSRGDASDLRECLDAHFREDLENMEPRKLFFKYGTHLIRDFSVGGCIMLDMRYHNHMHKTVQQVSADAAAAYSGLSFDSSTSAYKNAVSFYQNVSVRIRSGGGNSFSAFSVSDFNSQSKAWMDSLADKAVPFRINRNGSLPIWELTSNAARAKTLEKEFYLYNIDVLDEVKANIPFITDLRVEIRDKDNIRSVCPENWYVAQMNPGTLSAYDIDLNKGSGGKYIYLLYRFGTNQKDRITDIKILMGRNTKLGGYTRIDADLNTGSGGEYIYLAYKKEDNKEKDGIYGLGTTEQSSFTDNYWRMAKDQNNNLADLNKGAGGLFIYLLTYREKYLDEIEKEKKELQALADSLK